MSKDQVLNLDPAKQNNSRTPASPAGREDRQKMNQMANKAAEKAGKREEQFDSDNHIFTK